MTLANPVSIYVAASNLEARVLQDALQNQGIETHVTEDVSGVSLWMGGTVSQFHRPQLWVEAEAAERARAFVLEHEQRQSEQRLVEKSRDEAAQIEIVCENCGAVNPFAAALRGTIQACAECQEFLDVEDDEQAEDWAEWQTAAEDESVEEEPAEDE